MGKEELNLIFRRRSVRKYKEMQITAEELGLLQKAVQMAPSAMNEQPWFFVFVQNKDYISEIEALGNAQGCCYGAPTLCIAFADKKAIAPVTDTVFAMANIMYASTAMNLGTCYINTIKNVMNHPSYAKLKEALGVPEGFVCVGALAIGYPDEEKEMPTDRKSDIFSVVH